jgi:hypothetical protein
MKYAAVVIGMLLMAHPALAGELSEHDRRILDVVAAERGLNQEETLLLYAVRSHEAGRPGLECGIERPMAQVATDGFYSLLYQADDAAWIIKQRWDGNLWHFARSFHHVDYKSDREWRDCVATYLKRYREKYSKRGK